MFFVFTKKMQNAHLIVPDIACNAYFLTILSYEKTDANFANLIFPTKKGIFWGKLKNLFSKHLTKLSSFETHLKPQYFFHTQEYTGISQTSTLATATLAETDTASQTKAAVKVGHLAAKKSNLIGMEEQTDITEELLVPAGDAGKTANVTKVVRKDVTQRPVQHMHMQGVNIYILQI